MPRIVEFQETPNPNALKCILDGDLSPDTDGLRSFRRAADAAHDPLASRLMSIPGVSSVLLERAWLTVNKRPEAEWAGVKRAVQTALEDA